MKIQCRDLNLSATIESGQVFGFTHTPEGRYRGILLGGEVELWEEKGSLCAQSLNGGIPRETIENYFDLGRDLAPIYRILEEDLNLRILSRELRGLRIIRQDPWEALASFIISSNNNIKRIQLIWKDLVQFFPSVHPCFPKPSELARVSESDLRRLGLGYRAPFILSTAKRLTDNPDFLRQVNESNYEIAKDQLMELDGVGPKVADCALLFGFHKCEAFPVDVWMERVMKKLYFRKRTVTEAKIAEFARKKWGNSAGYIQQYLFHGARKGLI